MKILNFSLTSDERGGAPIPWVILCAVGLLVALQARFQLLTIPLERDEAAFSYIGYWMLRGDRLYTDMLDSKLPGLYIIYGLFTSLFGFHAKGVHFGLLLSNVLTIWLLYRLLNRLYDQAVALLASTFLALLLLSPTVYGFAAYATQLLLPFAVGGFLCFWRGIERGKLSDFFWSGVLLGSVVLIKQPGAVYGLLAAGLWFPLRLKWAKVPDEPLPWKEWIALGVGGLSPIVLTIVYFLLVGRLYDFYDATLVQPARLVNDVKIPSHFALMWENTLKVVDGYEAMWITALAGLVVIWFGRFKPASVWLGIGILVLGFSSVRIGVGYYPHYYVTALPGVALLAAGTLDVIRRRTGKYGLWYSAGLILLMIGVPMVRWQGYMFHPDYVKIHRDAYQLNLGPEMELLGRELGRRTGKNERIAILGSEPAVLMHAQRRSCTRHLFMYGLFNKSPEASLYQQEYFQDLKKHKPRYLVIQNVSGSWRPNHLKTEFFQKLDRWVGENYNLVGAIDIENKNDIGKIIWRTTVSPIPKPKTAFATYIFLRKDVFLNNLK
jgi:4-amino-4-deoxy-L-arabinose transferase-like glycosyltransferase